MQHLRPPRPLGPVPSAERSPGPSIGPSAGRCALGSRLGRLASLVTAAALVATVPAHAGPEPAARAVVVQEAGSAQESDSAAAAAARPVLRYVRVREGGVTARNLYDVKGVPVLEVSGGSLLAVYDERAGWLEVEVPGGFPVWVFGRFLRATGTPNVYEVTENTVLLRPNPGGAERPGFPLRQRLQAGDRVTVIGLEGGGAVDASIDLSKAWVNIWSPPGAGAWVQEARTEALGPDEDGAAQWRAAEVALLEAALARADGRGTVEAAAPVATGSTSGAGSTGDTGSTSATGRPAPVREPVADVARAREALVAARAKLAEERARPMPDWEAVRLAFEGVLALGPDPTTEVWARNELEKIELLAELAAVSTELRQRDQQQREALLQRQEDVWSQIEASHPFYGRFEQRGVLERFRAASGDVSYRIVRVGEVQAELVSRSGRYDLELFVGAEIGVRGEGLGNARFAPGIPQVDASRVEVLSAPRR